MKSLVVGMEGLGREAGELSARLLPKKSGATVVTLSGSLGAWKTAFAKALALEFGIE